LSALQRDFLRAFAAHPSGFYLTGGAVLVGWVLKHRRTDDLDLFTTDDGPMAYADRLARAVAADLVADIEAIQTSPDFRRCAIRRYGEGIVVDFIRERVPQLHPKIVREGITMDPVEEIVANKICALLGRAEIRDLVDLHALEHAGFPVEPLPVRRPTEGCGRDAGGAGLGVVRAQYPGRSAGRERCGGAARVCEGFGGADATAVGAVAGVASASFC
jgi:hypothetical protein